ncbi:response regulator transcription factor [Halarcobacter anaerophilus]|jgi:DNA-binding response OmpR family regulator|uniref:DNA-binding response regulator n=1 Tax=Halarcobacter anaerophilus TaxID=877500 RepID=A0A4Q0Y2D6_9BACT|nr:response regulator transcription factor [Halarcobacter anaerophilus]QDF27888.1 two-component system response regulator [Halarcobacter anaerophilus]RXJ64222.1 DNA-binding response regulator [Halarcobacter anaerophilus]
MKVLVLEDNERLSNVIKQALIEEGYIVDCFYDGDEAFEVLGNGYSCFILDINVPNLDGISILEYIRLNHSNTPVIIISSNHDLEKVQKSYETGCDDYLKKPFYIFELVQKVKKFCNSEGQYIVFNDLFKYDFQNHILYKDKEEIELTKKEILFLELFVKNLHHLASYEEIEEYVWEGEETNLINIRGMIKRLRKKIPEDGIVIVKGLGYSLNKNVKII